MFMKYRPSFRRSLAALLAVLLLASCASVVSDPPSVDHTSSESDTQAITENQTEDTSETPVDVPEPPSDEPDINVPKEGSYTLTSSLTLPEYTFGEELRAFAYPFVDRDTSGEIYQIMNDPDTDGGKLTFKHNGVNGLYTTVQSSGKEKATYEFDLTYGCPADTAPWLTFYMGLRLHEAKVDATGRSGIWLAFRNDEIGIRTGDWPDTTYVKVHADFSKGESLTVVDDPDTNTVTVYTRDGETLTEIACVKVTEYFIELYADGSDRPAASDIIVTAIPAGGYTYFWSHCVVGGATLDNINMKLSRSVGNTDNNGIVPHNRDLLADTWVGTDGAERAVTSENTSAARDRKVGIFYFLWHEANMNGLPIYDHTKAYLEGGMDGLWKEMVSGPLGFAHYWAEPYFGYYASDDAWVLRKHATQLTAAGVDFVYFDATNGFLYENSYEALLRVWSQMRAEGLDTPQVAFLMQNNAQELMALWGNLYEGDRYEDLWFRWNGKPLLLVTGDLDMPDDLKDFFTVRYSWANSTEPWYTHRRGIACWPWAHMYPQKAGYALDADGKRYEEQMVVMCGYWANGSNGTNGGRSYNRIDKGIPKFEGDWDLGFALMDTTSGLGLAFAEQFENAIKTDPALVMITGWNEWWAGRWQGAPAIGQTIANGYMVSHDPKAKEYHYFVDCFNPEYSRDIEAMKGGYTDNYYNQMVNFIRQYKGARDVEAAFGQWAIDIEGSVGQWYAVGPEYRDAQYDTAHRDHPAHVGGLHYTNTSGRNDIVTAKVSADDTYVYFMVECADAITENSNQSPNWMNLYINSDCDDATGWYGYDFIVNRAQDDILVSVEAFVGTDNWKMQTVGSGYYTLSENILQIKIHKSLIGVGDTFDFKWADNSVMFGDVMQFTDLGDAAPDGRLNYRYTIKAAAEKLPEGLTADMVVVKANGYNAYVNGKEVRLVENNTKGVALASGYDLWLPAMFVKNSLGIDTTSTEIFNHYGIDYVKANDLIERAGKTVTVTTDGLIVIAESEITDESLLYSLYRALH